MTPPPMYRESIGGSLIDSARISVMAAAVMFPEERAPLIVTPEAGPPEPTLHDCLEQAMNWLDAARHLSVEKGAPVTSLHVVDKAGG